MIAKTEPDVQTNSGVPVAQFLPEVLKDSLDEKIILIVGMSAQTAMRILF
jgi:hypothetical protein